MIDQLRVNPTAATSGVDIDVDDDLKKAGEAVKDVFTDDDRDSDKDGK